MQTEQFILPTHWAVYLVNSDPSYLSDDEQAQIDTFVDELLAGGYLCFHVMDVSEDSYFSRYHDADNGNYILTEVSEYLVQTA
jgi:hypothetical protein